MRKPHIFESDASEAVTTMGEIIPFDLSNPCRKTNIVWARYMVEYYLRSLGYSLSKISSLFRRDHSTVVHSVKEVEKMLESPNFYQDETKIWNEFQERLSLKK